MKADELLQYLKENGDSLRQSILEGTYKPNPVRRVEIPKQDGKKRSLGIPTAVDRVIQQAIAQVLSPIFEEKSHGVKGIIEFYVEYFDVDNNISAKNILKYVCKKNYRGHDSCSCGSEKRVRDCHKDIILFCKEDSRLDVLQNDFRYIEKERR